MKSGAVQIPAQNRQIKLALTIKESITCLLGYGLGDVNVLTALDWSTNVYEKEQGDYPHEVIQVVRTENPVPAPYRSKDGIVIVEVAEISEFCDEYIVAATELEKNRKVQQKALAHVAKLFAESEPETVNHFIDDDLWRRSALRVLAKFSVELVGEFESFLGACVKEIRHRSGKDGAFHQYAIHLDITLDILTSFPYKLFPPALFPIAADNLNTLSYYIGTKKGDSWAAYNTWNARKSELQKEVITELLSIARQNNYSNLTDLLKSL